MAPHCNHMQRQAGGMTSQPRLPFPFAHVVDERWPELLELLRQVADSVGRKQVAADLKIDRAVLDNMLAERARSTVKAQHLIYFALRSSRVVEWFAALLGGSYEPPRPLTPE